MRKRLLCLVVTILNLAYSYSDVSFISNRNAKYAINSNEDKIVFTALDIVKNDFKNVFSSELVESKGADIFIGTLGNNSIAEKKISSLSIDSLKNCQEGFIISVIKNKLYILGSDKRGTVYGLMEMSRIWGVSPWEWWADSSPEKKDKVILSNNFYKFSYPSVAHRGIFINDEDWGLMPWSNSNYEPSDVKGRIGPNTHSRIFELLLRLRANTFWPAMHACSEAFFLTPGNKEVADKYGIMIGTSHCEPMMRNTNAEWGNDLNGKYDYINNRNSVLSFWEDRVKLLSESDNIYTLGIRGVHDSKMLGANTLTEQKNALVSVLEEQRKLIAKYVSSDVTKIPQVFIPYKEVLDIYRIGLEIPEDITLMWCDDNYGYIRHFPDEKERLRKGGNGIYYHVSYWGRPHDYLWLATNHPAQLYTQMKTAYNKGAKEIWILNVGDIKPAEYLTELFLDMAWDINCLEDHIDGLEKHLNTWISREFGAYYADDITGIMNEYYRLAYIRKPEFMGNTRTEEKDPRYKIVSDLPWSEQEIYCRINDYNRISDKVMEISKKIPFYKNDSWFQLIEYPVLAAAEMNKKHLFAQLARHNKSSWQNSEMAYNKIINLTERYNSLNGGKWNLMMDYKARNLPVFSKIEKDSALTPLKEYYAPLFEFNGTDYSEYKGIKPVCHGLGYNRKAISIDTNSSVTYTYTPTDSLHGYLNFELALIPNHAIDNKSLAFDIFINNNFIETIDIRTVGRSEKWKENVLNNRTLHSFRYKLRNVSLEKGEITIKPRNEGIILDQIKIYIEE